MADVQGTESSKKIDSGSDQPKSEPQQDAITLLKADHKKVEELFGKYENSKTRNEKAQLARQIAEDLIVHAKIEEEIFYPACREHAEDEKPLDEAQVEHDSAKALISELIAGTPSDQYYDAKVKVLAEQIRHHVKEEEKMSEGIFAKAKKAGLDTDGLGQQLAQRKTELSQEIQRQGLTPPTPISITNRKKENSMRNDQRMPERDDQGRFMSGDDRGYHSRGRQSSSRYDNDDDYRSSGRSSSSDNRSRDDDGRYMSDDRGSSRDSRYMSDDRGSSRGRDDDDNRSNSRGSSSRSRSDYDDNNRSYGGYSSRGRSSYDDDNRRSSSQGSGWYGDSEGHAEAARLGWEHRDDDDRGSRSRSFSSSSRGGRSSSSYDDNDDRNYRSSGSRSSGGRSSSSGENGQGGWFGDPEGHSEAARKGWRNRDY